MRPLLILVLVAAAIVAFVIALDGTNKTTESVNMESVQPGSADQVDPTSMTSLEGAPDARTTATTDPVPETRVLHPSARRGNALLGQVVNQAGDAVADANVLLTRYGPTDFLTPLGGERIPDLETKTDEEGRFVFTDLEPNTDYAVDASHPEHGRRTEPYLSVADGQTSEEVRVILEPGCTMRGAVSDVSGQGIEDAFVRLSLLSVGNLAKGPGVLTTRTAGGGAYIFRNVSPGHYTLTVQASGFGKIQLQRLEVSGNAEIVRDISLEVGLLIAGTIRNATDGTPIEDARVEAYSTDRRQESTVTNTTSDEDGIFELDDVRQGNYTLLVRRDGYKHHRIPRVETGQVQLEVDLIPLPEVSGVVLGSDGSPLANFTVQLRQSMPNSTQATPVPNTRVKVRGVEGGEYAIACPRAGTFFVEANHPRYAASFSEPFTVEEAEGVSGIVVRMTHGGSLTGRVIDGDGSPVAGALVKTHHTDYVDDPFWRSLGDQYPSAAARKETRTDSDGSYELEGLTAETYQLHIDHPDHAPTTLRSLIVEDGMSRKVPDTILLGGASVTGMIYGPSGAGLPGALVQITLDAQATGDPHGAFYKVRTNAEGRYSFKHLPPGQYRISVHRQAGADNPFVGMADQKASRRSLSLANGRSFTQDFTLKN